LEKLTNQAKKAQKTLLPGAGRLRLLAFFPPGAAKDARNAYIVLDSAIIFQCSPVSTEADTPPSPNPQPFHHQLYRKRMNTLNDLFYHMHWADAKVWTAVLATETAAADEKISNLFYHIHSVQRAFLAVWTQSPIALPKRDQFVSMQQIADWGRTYHAELPSVLSSIDSGDLERIVSVPWSRFMEKQYGHAPEDTTLHETMHQVIMHSTYHRGQVNARLRELEGEPPMVDYIGWLWFGRPAPQWT